jgi:hypothetical protein
MTHDPLNPPMMTQEEMAKVMPLIEAELKEIVAAAQAEAKNFTSPPKTLQELLDFMAERRERTRKQMQAVWRKYGVPYAGHFGPTTSTKMTVSELEALARKKVGL